jgi:hypothetical protein
MVATVFVRTSPPRITRTRNVPDRVLLITSISLQRGDDVATDVAPDPAKPTEARDRAVARSPVDGGEVDPQFARNLLGRQDCLRRAGRRHLSMDGW